MKKCDKCGCYSDRDALVEAAMEYYEILEQVPPADPVRVGVIKDRLDELEEPFLDNVVWVAFLKRKRVIGGW